MSTQRIPLPPDDLACRVGSQLGEDALQLGIRAKACVLRALGEDYAFKDKRILDFGCGVGRLMRHFVEEARGCEFWGCDIYHPSIEWVQRHLVPPFQAVATNESPPLPFTHNYFDLVMALSVFTHLTESWEAWLTELRRIMKPGAIALLTFHHKIAYEYSFHKPFEEEKVGMEVFYKDAGWDSGGPAVFHSDWWVRQNWGRIMPVERIIAGGMDNWQSIALLRKPENV